MDAIDIKTIDVNNEKWNLMEPIPYFLQLQNISAFYLILQRDLMLVKKHSFELCWRQSAIKALTIKTWIALNFTWNNKKNECTSILKECWGFVTSIYFIYIVWCYLNICFSIVFSIYFAFLYSLQLFQIVFSRNSLHRIWM